MSIEGGGKYAPVKEDFFQRIVNVNWPGGGFVVSGTARDATVEGPMGVFYSKDGKDWKHTHIDPGTRKPSASVADPATELRSVGMDKNYISGMAGGAIKDKDDQEKRIIVAGGFRSDITSVDTISTGGDPPVYSYHSQTKATLFYSEDGGETWTEAHNPVIAPVDFPQVGTGALAFDPASRTFFGDVSRIGATTAERFVISSTDGKTWKIDTSASHDPAAGSWTAPFVTKIMGLKNNGLTEIISADGNTTLTYTGVTASPSSTGGGIFLEPPFKCIDAESGRTTICAIPFGNAAYAGLAYAGGQFMVAGSLLHTADNTHWEVIAYLSGDNGQTWKRTLNDSSTFITYDAFSSNTGGIGCAGSNAAAA